MKRRYCRANDYRTRSNRIVSRTDLNIEQTFTRNPRQVFLFIYIQIFVGTFYAIVIVAAVIYITSTIRLHRYILKYTHTHINYKELVSVFETRLTVFYILFVLVTSDLSTVVRADNNSVFVKYTCVRPLWIFSIMIYINVTHRQEN